MALVLVAGACSIATPLQAGAEFLLYPFARAFGSPSESELARCREAFRQFQAGLSSNPVDAMPVLVVTRGAGNRTSEWRPDLALQLAQRGSAAKGMRLEAVAGVPAIAPPELGRNQLRYAWKRAVQYSELVRTKPTGGKHVLFTEVWADHGAVSAIHLFIVTPAGQIAYCRWFNSHQMGKDLSFADGSWIGFAVQRMERDFARTAEELFPPYGVG